MKNPLPVVFLACLSALSSCLGVPETLELIDGRKLEAVTSARMEDEKVRVAHSGGVMRIFPADFTAASRKALGIASSDPAAVRTPEIKQLVTLDGKTYEDIRSVRVKPSFISFVHRDGSASVRFEAVSEGLRKLFHYDKAAADTFDKAREQAETAMLIAERNETARVERIAYTAEVRKRREQSLNELYFTNYGSDRYWMGSQRERDLMDALAAKSLSQGGYSPQEAAYQLNRVRFR